MPPARGASAGRNQVARLSAFTASGTSTGPASDAQAGQGVLLERANCRDNRTNASPAAVG